LTSHMGHGASLLDSFARCARGARAISLQYQQTLVVVTRC
jgi:hypothetical protein